MCDYQFNEYLFQHSNLSKQINNFKTIPKRADIETSHCMEYSSSKSSCCVKMSGAKNKITLRIYSIYLFTCSIYYYTPTTNMSDDDDHTLSVTQTTIKRDSKFRIIFCIHINNKKQYRLYAV